MVVVAVVGGTGSVGKTIVESFVQDGKHDVLVLARKASDGPAPVIAVDYADIPALTRVLNEKNVHTVISTITMYDPAAGQAERNLIAAADASASTKRFVASCWGTSAPEDESLHLPIDKFRLQSLAALRDTKLEWTQVHNGLFLDYFCMPHVPSHLSPWFFGVDVAHRAAAIPGSTGDEVIALTHTRDLGRFVVKSLELEKWEESLRCYSDFASLKDVLGLAEEATGCKFSVTYDSVEKLQRGEVTELPSQKDLYAYIPKPFLQELLSKFGLWTVKGLMVVEKEGSLNKKFPEVKTLSVREAIAAWKGH